MVKQLWSNELKVAGLDPFKDMPLGDLGAPSQKFVDSIKFCKK